MPSIDETDPESICLGVSGGSVVRIPLHYLTRHCIIAGSTGSGKSRAMQLMAEQLADRGISVFVSDVKGDASGFCVPCAETEVPDEHPQWPDEFANRNALAPFKPHALRASYWSVGPRFSAMRFSLQDAGSILLSRLLSLNPTQESHLVLAFSYARKSGLALDDITQLQFVLDEMVRTGQRGISPPSVSVIQRKLAAMEDSGLGRMFGKPSLDLFDLSGLNVLNLSDARKDMSASIAPAFILNKLFNELPEVGDSGRPRFAIFFDEAHYLFKDSNKSLRDLMVTILKQIRSKGVAVFFITQDATDLPEEILSQLSTKIIFSQKTLTEKSNARLRALAKSFPNAGQDFAETLKSLPPGTAIISSLDRGGNQTAPKEVKVFAPASTMEVVPDDVLRKFTDPKLIAKYNQARPAPASKTPLKATIKPEPSPPRELKHPEQKEMARKSIWDGVFSFLLKLLDFLLKALAKIARALIIKPSQNLIKWMFKKPVRIFGFLLFIVLVYFIFVNWPIMVSLLERLKLH